MCIIAAKPQNVDMPSQELLENMWYNNTDGAGFMYNKDGKVQIEKGFMTYDAFEKALEEAGKTTDLKKAAVVLHFRITTHGGTKPENCHPFPVTDSIGLLKKRKLRTRLGVAHNGIIDITPRKDISDTMEYILSQLGPLQRAVPKFYKNKDLMEMISNAIDSKMAFLDKEGKIYTIGKFIEEGGIKYSNATYKTWRYAKSSYYGYSKWDKWASDYPGYASYPSSNTSFAKSGSDNSIWVYTSRALMWLDEAEGEFIVDADGQMECGDYAIDCKNRVYTYSDKYSAMVHVPYAVAYNASGGIMKYDPHSKNTFFESVYESKSKETGGYLTSGQK